jgi:hypothetical protein
MHPWSEILSKCDEIEELLRHAVPGVNEAHLQSIQAMARSLGGHDSYISDKANNLSSRAAIFFSARRHASYQGGADNLLREMRYSLLGRIRDQAQSRMAASSQ